MGETIIEIENLTKKYGSHIAVDNLNLNIEKGEIFSILGPNGAGKSTTILMIMGLTEPDSGSVKVCGIDSTSNPVDVKRKVGYLPENVGFYEDLSGFGNLLYTAKLNSINLEEATSKAHQLLHRVGLINDMNKKAGKYSRGMRQRLGLADVLIKNPEIIILDEPTLGIDPTGIREFLDLIVKLSKEEKITVLLTSHNLHQVQQISNRVGLFVNGQLLASGNIHSLSQKLFSTNPFTIEAIISFNNKKKKENHDFPGTESKTLQLIRDIEGVKEVKIKNNMLQIECIQNLTPEIARVIYESGADLNYLNKKEYGLDDIYYRYFEGGEKNEK